eukprot:356552-Chlamydomonas_euryale.AAC.3
MSTFDELPCRPRLPHAQPARSTYARARCGAGHRADALLSQHGVDMVVRRFAGGLHLGHARARRNDGEEDARTAAVRCARCARPGCGAARTAAHTARLPRVAVSAAVPCARCVCGTQPDGAGPRRAVEQGSEWALGAAAAPPGGHDARASVASAASHRRKASRARAPRRPRLAGAPARQRNPLHWSNLAELSGVRSNAAGRARCSAGRRAGFGNFEPVCSPHGCPHNKTHSHRTPAAPALRKHERPCCARDAASTPTPTPARRRARQTLKKSCGSLDQAVRDRPAAHQIAAIAVSASAWHSGAPPPAAPSPQPRRQGRVPPQQRPRQHFLTAESPLRAPPRDANPVSAHGRAHGGGVCWHGACGWSGVHGHLHHCHSRTSTGSYVANRVADKVGQAGRTKAGKGGRLCCCESCCMRCCRVKLTMRRSSAWHAQPERARTRAGGTGPFVPASCIACWKGIETDDGGPHAGCLHSMQKDYTRTGSS